jgi:hypothetical protein
LEAPLSRVDTSQEAAEMLRMFFLNLMLDQVQKAAVAKASGRNADIGES